MEMLLDREYMPYKGWMNMKKRHVAIFVIAAIVAFGAGMGFGMWENKNVTHYEAKEPLPEESIISEKWQWIITAGHLLLTRSKK